MTDPSDTFRGFQWKKRTAAEKSLMIAFLVFNVLFWLSIVAGAPYAIQVIMFSIWFVVGIAAYYLLGFFRYVP